MDGPHNADHADQAFQTLGVVEEEHRLVGMPVSQRGGTALRRGNLNITSPSQDGTSSSWCLAAQTAY